MTVSAPLVAQLVSGLPRPDGLPVQAAFRVLDSFNAKVAASLASLEAIVRASALFTERAPLTSSTAFPVEVIVERSPILVFAAVRDISGQSWTSCAVTWTLVERAGRSILRVSAIAGFPVPAHSYEVNLLLV